MSVFVYACMLVKKFVKADYRMWLKTLLLFPPQDVGMPADYINKLARMFQDIKVSNDLNQDFKTEYKNKGDIAGTVASQLLPTELSVWLVSGVHSCRSRLWSHAW